MNPLYASTPSLFVIPSLALIMHRNTKMSTSLNVNTTGIVKTPGVIWFQLVRLKVSLPELLTQVRENVVSCLYQTSFPGYIVFPPPSRPGMRVARTLASPQWPGYEGSPYLTSPQLLGYEGSPYLTSPQWPGYEGSPHLTSPNGLGTGTLPPPSGPGTRVACTLPPPSGLGTRVAYTSPPPSGLGTRVAYTSPPPSGLGMRIAYTSPVPMQSPVVDESQLYVVKKFH